MSAGVDVDMRVRVRVRKHVRVRDCVCVRVRVRVHVRMRALVSVRVRACVCAHLFFETHDECTVGKRKADHMQRKCTLVKCVAIAEGRITVFGAGAHSQKSDHGSWTRPYDFTCMRALQHT